MRSDSRLDLVAKSLALLGLGLLAATGALVDPWSADRSLAGAPSPFDTAGMPSVQTAIDLPIWAKPAAGSVAARSMSIPVAERVVTDAVRASIEEAIATSEPPVEVASLAPAVSVGWAAPAASMTDLSAPPQNSPADETWQPRPMMPIASA